MQALPAGQQGPIAGVSTINARLPQASLANQGASASSAKPPGMLPGAPMALADDESDDEPAAKKPRLDDGSLVAEENWVNKYPTAIAIVVQMALGADALAAGINPAMPLEVTARMKVQELKAMLQPKVAAAGVNVANMKLKASGRAFTLGSGSFSPPERIEGNLCGIYDVWDVHSFCLVLSFSLFWSMLHA